jgi:hypothetical protein
MRNKESDNELRELGTLSLEMEDIVLTGKVSVYGSEVCYVSNIHWKYFV